jgi:hypothetical protein
MQFPMATVKKMHCIQGAPKFAEQFSSRYVVKESLKYQVKMFKKSVSFFVEDMDLFVTLNVAASKNILGMCPNSLQIFHFCCIHGNEREKSKPCCRTLFEVKWA